MSSKPRESRESDVFGTYLETVQKHFKDFGRTTAVPPTTSIPFPPVAEPAAPAEPALPPPKPAEPEAAPKRPADRSAKPAAEEDLSQAILDILLRNGPQSIADLKNATGQSLTNLMREYEKLEKFDLVAMKRKRVHLTEVGRQAAGK